MSDPEIRSDPDVATEQGGGLRMPRRRGAVSGVLLLLAGAWGAFVPFVGPYFHFAYTPKPTETWHWTAARGWYEVLPGGLAVVGGLLLILSANRIVTSFGAWIAALAGGWFVVGQPVSLLLTLGSPGAPSAAGDRRYVAEYLSFFTGLGAVIILLAAVAIGRLSVRSVRDVRAATRREQDAAAAEQEATEREARERDEIERASTDRAVTDRNAQTWAAGDERDGYGTPGTSDAAAEPTDRSASDVTTELPVAGAGVAAGAGGLYAGERLHDDDRDDAAQPDDPVEHAPYRRADAGRDASPDDDTAALPVASEPDASEPVTPEPVAPEPEPVEPEPEPEPIAPEPVASEPVAAEPVTTEPVAPELAPEPVAPEPEAAEPVAAEPVTPEPEPDPEPVAPEPAASETAAPEPTATEPTATEPTATEPNATEPNATEPNATEPNATEPPIVLDPPEGHDDTLRLVPPEPAGSADVAPGDAFTSEQTAAPWNPEAQSPTTTGEIPAIGANPSPPVTQAPRRGIQQPRRYYGPNDPARPAEPPTEDSTPELRDPVRTDEAEDLDDMDLDERR